MDEKTIEKEKVAFPREEIRIRKLSKYLSTQRAIAGSLPFDFRISNGKGELVPATLFAPTHLRSAERIRASLALDIENDNVIPRSISTIASHSFASTAPPTDLPTDPMDSQFLGQVEAMLLEQPTVDAESRFKASATDASYDFDEYAMLRNPDDPIAFAYPVGTGTYPEIPSDPRFQRFVEASRNGIRDFVDYISLRAYSGQSKPSFAITVIGVTETMFSWWLQVCSVRAFNQFGRYSPSLLKNKAKELGLNSSEELFGQSLMWCLSSPNLSASQEVLDYLNGDRNTLDQLLTAAFWNDIHNHVIQLIEQLEIDLVDPTAPQDDYPFEPYPADEIFFGLRIVHRQNWHLLGYARGDLVKSIPLGPRESQKISIKIQRRSKTVRAEEQTSSFETTSETGSSTKDTSEVVDEASKNLNRHFEAEVSGGYATFFNAKVSGGISEDIGSTSRQTKSRLNEIMEKTANRMKRDTKVTVNTEREDTFEDTRTSELVNPNDEIAVTYLYHRLQQRYYVSTSIAEVYSVVFVPEPLPAWWEIDEEWLRQHGDIIATALLDPGFAPILSTIRKEPSNLVYSKTNIFEAAANAGINAAKDYKNFTGGGAMPDLLASGQQSFERHFERENSLSMDQARRKHQVESLLTHVRRNILHYMRALWKSEDYDQRMQRYSRMRVPTEWTFVPRKPIPSGTVPVTPLEVEGVFTPLSGSARPLTEVIDPIGPIGYLFNCAIYRLRDDPKLANLHQALAYLRSTYTKFAVNVMPSSGAGVAVRQVTAYSPRSFSADYQFEYRSNRGVWLLPIPGRSEMDWYVIKKLPDGSLDALGIRIWLDGQPKNGDILSVRIRVTGELEDPHLRLVQIRNPLPLATDEEQVFTERLLQEMAVVLPELAPPSGQSLVWGEMTEEQKERFRSCYHLFLMERESGRLVTLDTANVVLDLEISRTPALEPFKRLHRYVDVMKEYAELQKRVLENRRREELLKKGVLGDPDIERVSLVGSGKFNKDLIAVTEEITDEDPIKE